ncbi:hypothetical protein CDD83_9343 [Cordyceps sp. RAO-2017]|nr:hypothetical protein CDD83_9343 [Cordyceps sp. RAO-2017]
MDDQELDRLDMCHAMFYAILDKKRFLAPIGPNPQRILDLGCGSAQRYDKSSPFLVSSEWQRRDCAVLH